MITALLPSRYYLAFSLFCIFSITAFSQDDVSKTLATDNAVRTFEVNKTLGTASFIYFVADNRLENSGKTLARYFGTDPTKEEFRSIQSTALVDGINVERFKLYYQGIPVEHSAYVMSSRNGQLISINAESYSLPADFNPQPGVTKQLALQKALDFVNAKKYAWEGLEEDIAKTSNPAFRQKLEALRRENEPGGELVIAKDVYGKGEPRLAWKFTIYATEPLGRYFIYIDAQTGALLLRDMIIKHVGENTTAKKITPPETPATPHYFDHFFAQQSSPEERITASEVGIAHTRYAGVRNIYTTRVTVPLLGTPDPNNPSVLLTYSGTDPRTPILSAEQVFILKDDTRGNGIETYDMNGVGGVPLSLPGLHAQSLAFVDRNVLAGSENVWRNEAGAGTNEDHIRGATSNGTVGADEASNDDIALDAHWGAEMVYDYWKNVHGRFSYDNRNSAIKSYIHYGPAYDNAFWNGSVMTYGDGGGSLVPGSFKPLTSLDVCGHEIGHGVCSFTSDLVYEKESGAMNEAFSDIWAASIERWVVVTIDPSLAATYKFFSIGEQISASPASPLRRMDDPKAAGNPDTYGGENWSNPNCTPTLANDQCGVHNNSGVLNKWYYLLTVGSGAGSGPDVAYAVPGADDGMKDNGAIYNSIPYSVTGIGFNKAQAIAYLTEMLLTPTSTFADARIAAINAARILYGECSNEEVSVTNAWFAVGVGAAYTTCALPVLSVSALITDVRETAGGLDCERYNEYNINVNLTVAQATPVTVTFTAGATTLSPDEYSLSAALVTYNIGETGLRTIKLRIYDDAMVEADESIDINVNSITPALSQVISFTVRNDDADPVIGGMVTLLSENFEAFSEGPLGAPAAGSWGKLDKMAGNIQWAVRIDGAVPGPISFSSKRAIIEMTAPVPLPGEALYDQLTSGHTLLRAPLIDASGLNTIKVQFNYQAGGEPACDPACDYAQLVYSFDGTNFSPFFDLEPFFLTLTDANFEYILPPSFNGKQFYLAIQWYNDANGGVSGSVTIDNFIVTAQGRGIESELNETVSEKVNAETNKPSYFYSTADGEIITRISNSTAHNYGCVSATIEKTGNLGFDLYIDGIDKHRVADKITRVIPTNANPAGSYTIRLYFTEQQILAIEGLTSVSRNSLFIYKTTAANYTGANALNTTRAAATYTAIPGFGGSFSASFATGVSGGFALGAAISIVLPVDCIEFKAVKNGSTVRLNWKVSDNSANSGFTVERSADGVNYTAIGTVGANTANAGNYYFDDNNAGAVENYYRLRQTDINGSSRYICSILKLPFGNGRDFVIGNIFPNPASAEAYVNVFTSKTTGLHIEHINTAGQLVYTNHQQLQAGTTRIALNTGTFAHGTYLVRFRNENGELLASRTYIRN